MAKTITVPKDLIPYEAGVVIVTPLDANKKPDYSKAVATQRDFLTSTQTSVTRTTETLPNGNGQDKEYIISESYTLTVVGNTYNPDFHATIAGRIQSQPETILMPLEVSMNLPKDSEQEYREITFGADGKDFKAEPAADEDGEYFFIVEDSYGNRLTPADDTTTEGTYHYDKETKALQFPAVYAEQLIRVVYKTAVTTAVEIRSNPVLQQPEFQIETFGLRASAASDKKYRTYIKLARATTTGDLSEQTTQKSRVAPLTYTFATAPVPVGTSVYTEVTAPYEDEATE